MARDASVGSGAEPSLEVAEVAGALHDVSNALTVILGWAAEARVDGASRETLLHSLEVIEDQARVARQLARRAIGAAEGVDEEETRLEIILAAAVDALVVPAQRAGVRLSLAGRPAGVRVRKGTDLRQILTNLVLNGLAHAPKGSEVRLELAVGLSDLSLDVQDDGPGVPLARRESIFYGDSQRDGGAGVGLRHARALAEAAAGNLELASSERGARFRISWPRWVSASMPPPSVPPSAAAVPVLSGTRVLVVEDDEHVALLLETALATRGATVRLARSAAEFETLVASEEHDLALIDLSPLAPDLPGALRRLRQRSPKAALVFISGSAAGLPDDALLLDVRWVQKPFEISEVIEAALAALRGRVSSP
jgi:CheY-like chemotaxis protein